jgi:hypothetical protein
MIRAGMSPVAAHCLRVLSGAWREPSRRTER